MTKEITMTKKPTKRDLIVALAKIYKIKSPGSTMVEMLVTTLNEILKDDIQRVNLYYSINRHDWNNIIETFSSLLEKNRIEEEEIILL